MAFLDFMKNKPAQSEVPRSQAPSPQTAKEMYTQQAAQEKADAKPISPEIKAQADRAMETINKASQHLQSPSAPIADGGGNSAHLQKQNQQDKTQAALSPTDSTAGKTAAQEKEKAPEKTVSRAPQTVSRRPPSWER